MEVPQRARVVVIGGGIIGCSVAYHLAHMGRTDVVVLERDKITSGTTWHAAGRMVTFGSTSETSTEMRKYSCDLYGRLEEETGQSTGFRRTGFIEVASDPDRLEEYRRVSAFNRLMGINVHEISPQQVQDLFPLANVDDVLAGFYVKEDGRADPVGVTMALAKGARLQGAKIFENVAVTGITKKRGVVTGVDTAFGHIEAEYVVNCAGMWARQLGGKAGVCIPNQAAEHYYLITERIPELSKDWPVLEDPASYVYFREEVGGLMIGLFEPLCAPWNVGGIPDDFSFGEIQPDWDRMGPYVETAMSRVPRAMTAGVKKFFCGPESFTPDLRPIVGEAPELKNFFVAAGLNSIGILTGGGMGRVMAHWIINGRPDVDVTGMHVDRLHPYQTTPDYRRTRTVESLGMVYKCHYPTHSMQTARGAKVSPIHARLVERGAYFRDVSGWEGADWYLPGANTIDKHSWQRQHWFDTWASEHAAAREGVILMDMSFMSKFRVEGRDAGRLLDWISGNSVNGASGQITYTQWMDEAGKLQADLTVTKLDDERYWVVASDTAHRHVETWMKRALSGASQLLTPSSATSPAATRSSTCRGRGRASSCSSSRASTWAPRRSRSAPRARSTSATRACCAFASRISASSATSCTSPPSKPCTSTIGSSTPAPRSACATRASRRSPASAWRRAIATTATTSTTPTASSRPVSGFAADLKKPDFVGKAAIVAQKAAGPLKKRLLQVRVDDPQPLLFHAEIVKRDGKPHGYVRAASYGHTLGGAVGLAMIDGHGDAIDGKWIEAGKWEIDIAGKSYPATASLKPFYDPENKRVKM